MAVCALALLFAVSGCDGDVMHKSGVIHKKIVIDNGKGLSLGARQRTILVSKNGGKDGKRQVVCVEPSPDVFAVRAASAALATKGVFRGQENTEKGQQSAADAGFSTSESAATISRKQTIQLLRDGLFRLCEAYMNGAVDETQYNVALVNMDKLMASLLAIDTIGGTAFPPAVGITAGEAGENISDKPDAPGNGDSKTNKSQDASKKFEVPAKEISKTAPAHRRLGDKIAALVAMCVGIMNRTGDRKSLTSSQQKLNDRCNAYLEVTRDLRFMALIDGKPNSESHIDK
jgi:hypothetical protein